MTTQTTVYMAEPLDGILPNHSNPMATHTQKSTLIRNTVESMAEVSARIKMRYVANCRRTDLEYGDRSASALGLGTTVR